MHSLTDKVSEKSLLWIDHRITESLKLEKSSKIKFNCQPISTTPAMFFHCIFNLIKSSGSGHDKNM